MKKILMSIATVNMLFAANVQLAPEGTNWFDATSDINVIISGKSNDVQKSSFNLIDGNENQLYNNTQYDYIFGNRNLLNAGADNYIYGSDNKDNGSYFAQNKIFGDSNIFNATGDYRLNYIFGNNNTFLPSTISGDTITDNNYIIGRINHISGSDSYVLGSSNYIYGSQNFSIGMANTISDTALSSYVFGKSNTISSNDSFAFGRNNIISNASSMAFGFNNNVSGANSFAFGSGITVTGDSVGDFGNKTLRASGTISNNYDLINKSYLDSRLAGLSSGGVDAATVDAKIATASSTILTSANGYTDSVATTTLNTVNTNIATASTTTLNSANNYADTKVAGLSSGGVDAATVDAKIATASSTILTTANGYTDSVATTTLNSANTNIATASSNTLNSANTYTDTKVSGLSTGGVDEATVDAKIATASNTTLNNGKTYTDTKTSMISNDATTTSFTKVSNVSGNSHGLYISNNDTTITGGTTSSSLTLNDNGATFAKVSDGSAIKVNGVATGTADTDAANTKQVADAKNSAIATANGYTDTKTASTLSTAQAYADSVGITTLNNAKTYTDSVLTSINGVTETSVDNKISSSENKMMEYTDNRINSLEQSLTKEYRSATATAIALGVSPILANGNKNALGMGFGNYEGENAVAINYVAELDKNTHLQLGTSLSSTNHGFKAGVSYGW